MTTWADPPPRSGPLSPLASYTERLRPLVDNPGRWALIKSGTYAACNNAATMLRHRGYHYPEGKWQFTCRSFRRGVHVGDMTMAQLYARYLGPVPEDEEWCNIRRRYVKRATHATT